jgi:hypothetical protein
MESESPTLYRRHGGDWSFTLPAEHTAKLSDDGAMISLSTPQEGTTFEVLGVPEIYGERVVLLGAAKARHGSTTFGDDLEMRGYLLPEIHDEFSRLRGRWERAGLPFQEFEAYAAGSTHEDRLRAIRARLRETEA